MIAPEALEAFATRIAAIHKPIAFDWRTRFGLDDGECAARSTHATAAAASPDRTQGKAAKLSCAACGAKVNSSVARFCWLNKVRLGGAIYCMDCQKGVDAARE